MTARLEAKFAPAFSGDLKRKAVKRNWNLAELEKVVDLVLENSTESLETLRTRPNMHHLSGKWEGSSECHVANVGDRLAVWRIDDGRAYFQCTGSA